MDPYLEQLIPIAKLDDALFDLKERTVRAKNKIAKADKGAKDASAARQAIDDQLAALKKEEKAHAAELTRLENLLAAANRALAEGMGDPDVAQRQIEKCSDLIDEHETGVLEIMETRDDLIEQGEAAKTAEAEAAANAADTRSSLLPQIDAFVAETKAKDGERTTLVAALPRDIRNQYTSIHSQRGSALAELVDETCTACRHVVPLMRGSDVRAGRLVHCDGCGRWLYVEPQPVAK